MIDRTILESRWNEMQGRIKEAWGALTDDDMTRISGRWDQLVSIVREKTGATTDEVESKLDELIDSLERTTSSLSG